MPPRWRRISQAPACRRHPRTGAACHTVKGGTPFAGGRAFKLPFGTLYTPNITPDVATGIGSWSDADFIKAVHKGIGKDGERLYHVTLAKDGTAAFSPEGTVAAATNAPMFAHAILSTAELLEKLPQS